MRTKTLGVALVATMVIASVASPLSASAVTPTAVATASQLATALGATGSYVVTADIPANDTYYDFAGASSGTISLDLHGHDVTVNDIQLATSESLTITDSTSSGGTLTVTDSVDEVPGILVGGGMSLTINGTAQVDVTGRSSNGTNPGLDAIGAPNVGGQGDPNRNLGTVTIGGSAVVEATGGTGSSTEPGGDGIGGALAGNGGTVNISGSAFVTATGGGASNNIRGGTGIGGGGSGRAGSVSVSGSAVVIATGESGGAGIGSGADAADTIGGTVAVSGSALVHAYGGGSEGTSAGGAGIGGGSGSSGSGSKGETVTVSGTSVVMATGGPGAAGIGGGPFGAGGSLVTSGTADVEGINGSGASAIGIGSGATSSGQISIGANTLLRIPSGSTLTIPTSWAITVDGWIDDYGAIAGTGSIINNGYVRLADPSGGTGTVATSVSNHNYSLSYSANGGGFRAPGPTPTRLYAETYQEVGATLPASNEIARSGYTFRGWVTNSNGAGTPVSVTTDFATLLGSSTGAAIASTLYASWLANTSTTLTPADGSVVYGNAALITASTGAGTTGVVSFTLDGAPRPDGALSSGTTTTTIPAGTAIGVHTVTATYAGDSTHAGSTASTTVTISPIPTSLSLSPAAGSATVGTDTTLIASLTGGGTGSVSFAVDGTALSSGALANGQATATLPSTLAVGEHTVTASYPGDATHAPSTASTTETVTASPSNATLPPTAGSSAGSGTGSGTTGASSTTSHPKLVVTARKFAKHHRPKVTVTFSKLAKSEKVSGTITIYVASKKILTVKIVKKTTVTVKLPKSYATTISIKAKYLGSSNLAPTTSRTVRVHAK